MRHFIRELVVRRLKPQARASAVQWEPGSLGTAYCLAPAQRVWVVLAVCEALYLEKESGRGSECLLHQHFFDSVKLEKSGIEQ